jgi:hypothetical protein
VPASTVSVREVAPASAARAILTKLDEGAGGVAFKIAFVTLLGIAICGTITGVIVVVVTGTRRSRRGSP